MMKKKLISFTLIGLLLFCFNIKNVNAADKTLGDLKNALNALKKEKTDNANAKSKTQNEINDQNNKISDAHAQVEQAENDIEVAKNKIDESNKKIEETKEESSKLLVFYEVMDGENELMQYISGASSMTDLVMRANAVSQILNYNQEKLKTLENLIEDNKQLQVDLKKKEEDLNQKIVQYQNSISSLKNDLSSLVKISLDIDKQISAQQDLIKYYENMGCKDNQYLSECEDISNNVRWVKPLNKGYISSTFGYRKFTLNGKLRSDFHAGLDIAGNPGGTNIYAAANGLVAAVIKRASCGGNQVYIHVYVNGQPYTITYAHMMDIYVKVGDKVTTQTVVGTVGGGGKTLRVNGGWDTCSTGYHLHFGVAKGHYLGNGYSSYSTYVANSILPPNMPSYGSWFYSRY